MSSKAVDAVQSDESRWTERSIDPGESPSMAVVEVVASVRNEPLDRLECLYDVVDPDALDALLEDDVSVRFAYAGCLVDATGDRVRVSVVR